MIRKQFVRYLLIGGLSNGLGYVLYIGLTLLGVNPLFSMSVVYLTSSMIAFTANRAWTFESNQGTGATVIRYILVQFLGYVTNLSMLALLHHGLGLPHYLVQLTAIGVVAIMMFLLSRCYVFN
jgi:putative flippase GtrA